MMSFSISIRVLLFIFLQVIYSSIYSKGGLTIGELPSIPDKEGFAGMFAGISNDILICAGGANFSGPQPWNGGREIWYDHIYYLEAPDGEWKLAKERLANPLAYGLSVTYQDELILIGGSDSSRHYREVLGIKYSQGNFIFNNDYPDLPVPLANHTGALIGDKVFVAGGLPSLDGHPLKKFYCLDLTIKPDQRKWEELEPWPGKRRMYAVGASLDNKFYLFSGIDLLQGTEEPYDRELLTDAYVYDSETGEWEKLPDLPRSVAAGPNPAPVIGLSHIVFAGGLVEKADAITDPVSHPGFLEDILAYNTQSNQYVTVGMLPDGAARVTLPATRWNNIWVVPNGESRLGIRSTEVFTISNQVEFGFINWLFLFLYLGIMIYIGYFFSNRGKSTDDFFVAGRRIPWWAAGISIYGTQLSAITFMAIPSIVYATDWRLIIGSFMILLLAPIVIKFYLPFFRRLDITSAYEYLENRFNLEVRLIGSITFILMQLARMGIVMYLPAIAISSVTGINIHLCIAIMGVFATLYTVMGGIEAVIWTDVIQVIVLLGGAIFCMVIAIWNVDGGLMEVVTRGYEMDKFNIFYWGKDPSQLVVWVIVVGFFFLNLIPYTSDQTIIQRYLTVKDEKEAAKSLWTNGIITLPGSLIFYFLGTTLFIYYFNNPSVLSADKPDELLPYYIVQNLPVGVAGIVIAGVFAASMSSLDSSMNSIATAYITDIQKRFNRKSSDAHNLMLARWITVIVGIFGTVAAMFIAATHIDFIFNYFQEIVGMFGGSLAGVFILAIFTKKTNSTGAIAGVLGGAVVTWMVKYNTNISVYLYGAVGLTSSVLIGYVVSLVMQGKKHTQDFTYKSFVEKNDEKV